MPSFAKTLQETFNNVYVTKKNPHSNGSTMREQGTICSPGHEKTPFNGNLMNIKARGALQ